MTGLARPVAPSPDVDSSAVEQFVLDNGVTASTNVPVMKAALVCLYDAWPGPVPFDDLWPAVRSKLPVQIRAEPRFGELGAQVLAEAMLRCYLANLVALHVHPPRFALQVGERPIASPLARWQARSTSRLTNLRHRLVELGELDRIVLAHLDGSRDRAALLEVLIALVADKQITISDQGQPLLDPQKIRAFLSDGLEPCLSRLARNALLTA